MTNVLLEKKGPYAVATIHRPEALNALNSQVLADLAELLDTVEADKEIRVLVITGAGEKAFVAGADIGEMSTLTKAEGEAFGGVGLPLALAMLLRPKHFPLWYVVQLVKGISVLAILLSLISLIGCKYGVIVENDDIMNAVRLWPKGRGVCLVLLCAGLLLSVGSICAARPVQRVGEYFGIAKK